MRGGGQQTDFRLLGPVEVWSGEASLRLAGPKQRALLALLVLNANDVVSRERAIDCLWGERPPERAVNALQVQVHGLRRLLGSERIRTQGSGYVLKSDPDEVDAGRFVRLRAEGERALAEGDVAGARESLAAALSLWRGDPLADLPYGTLEAERLRLAEERQATMEICNEARLVLGEHEALIPELEALTVEYPFRERLHAQLMLGLYRSGRQADALAAYQRARRVLDEELGIEPGAALRELERAILRHDQSLRLPEPAPDLNLPVPSAPLIGRERELAEVCGLLRDGQARLVTLTGPGGVGKTRLALSAAAELAGDFRDGAYFVDLAPVRDPALVASAVLAALDIAEEPGRASAETLLAELRERNVLLVLDNFERLLEEAGSVAALVTSAPALRVLITSRVPLELAGEHEFRLAPLETPAAGDDLETVTQNDSVAIFSARAAAVDREFAVNRENASVIASICRALDGLPLALELAAARVKVLTPAQLLERIERPLELLTGGGRDLPPRQQALRATIDWSYDLLGERERRLFAELSVFADGCTLEAIEQTCGAKLESLASLLDNSLVLRVRSSATNTRFKMLDPVREYASERLPPDELRQARKRHAEYFAELAEGAAQQLIGVQAPVAVQALSEDHGNLRLALGYALEHDLELGFRLVGALLRYWESAGRGREVRAWLEQAFPLAQGPMSVPRVSALLVLGRQLIDAGEHESASKAFSEALTAARGLELLREEAFALTQLSWLQAAAGDQDESLRLGLNAIDVARNAGDRWAERLALAMVAGTFVERGEFEQARSLFDSSLALARTIGDRRTLVTALVNSAWAALRAGDLADARATLEEALVRARELDRPAVLISVLGLLGAEANMAGEPDRAIPYLLEALDLGKESGRAVYLLEGLSEVAIAIAGADPKAAARMLAAADEGYRTHGIVRPTAEEERIDLFRTRLESSLGEQDYRRARAGGSALTLEDAIDEVLATAQEQPEPARQT